MNEYAHVLKCIDPGWINYMRKADTGWSYRYKTNPTREILRQLIAQISIGKSLERLGRAFASLK